MGATYGSVSRKTRPAHRNFPPEGPYNLAIQILTRNVKTNAFLANYSLEDLLDITDFLGAPRLIILATHFYLRDLRNNSHREVSPDTLDVLSNKTALRPQSFFVQKILNILEDRYAWRA